MRYTQEEIEIIKDAIKEYDYISRHINHEIKEGASMEQLLDYLETEFNVDITNSELKDKYKYIDFNYGNITASVIDSDIVPKHLSKDIEIWNDKNCSMLCSNVNIDELRGYFKWSKD